MAGERTNRVVVGMSGGVDSSVAALRLLDRGYAVEGLFMKNWEEDDQDGVCMAADDLRDAQQVSDQLGIRLHTVNFATEYWDRVFRHFLDEYRAGRTPNPDVLCNREIKFRAFLEYARGLGADYIATGHYARIAKDDGRLQLAKGVDAGKDQSYFLYMLDQEQLASSLFPLGDVQKDTVRQQAKQAGFSNHRKKDSTGICFIGERRFREFLGRFLPAHAGKICTPDGRVVGDHHGLMYYTIGQRKGLGIGGQAGAAEEAWYVVGKDLERNVLQVAQGHSHTLLYSKELTVSQPHWIDGTPPPLPLRCSAKIRYRQSDQPCRIHRENRDRWRVIFDLPQWAIAPGQSVVFYQKDVCLGGGIILDSTGDISERW